MSVPDSISFNSSPEGSFAGSGATVDVLDLMQNEGEVDKKFTAYLFTFHKRDSGPALASADVERVLKPEAWMSKGWCKGITRWSAQWERGGETNREHVQAFVEFARDKQKKIRTVISHVRNDSPFMDAFEFHVEPMKFARKGAKEAKNSMMRYCMNPDKRAMDVWKEAFVIGDCGISRSISLSKNEVIDAIDEYLKEDVNADYMAFLTDDRYKYSVADKMWTKSYFNAKKQKLVEPDAGERRTIKGAVIYFGTAGTGKTTRVLKAYSETDVWRQPDEKYFGTAGAICYRNEPAILFDEYNGYRAIGFETWKEICDIGKLGPVVALKKGNVKLNHEHVYFTSNVDPLRWFKKTSEQDVHYAAFKRRVVQCVYYPRWRPDGRENVYDPEIGEECYSVEVRLPDVGEDRYSCVPAYLLDRPGTHSYHRKLNEHRHKEASRLVAIAEEKKKDLERIAKAQARREMEESGRAFLEIVEPEDPITETDNTGYGISVTESRIMGTEVTEGGNSETGSGIPRTRNDATPTNASLSHADEGHESESDECVVDTVARGAHVPQHESV